MDYYQEWLETDGLGGFASSTFSGIHTRRYHGWLFLAGNSPGERYLALSKLEDWVICSEGEFPLSSNEYPGVVYPGGADNILSVRGWPFPAVTWRAGSVILEREIFMIRGVPGVFCVYRLLRAPGSHGVSLKLIPLCASRYYHHLGREGYWNPRVDISDGRVVLDPHASGNPIVLCCPGSKFRSDHSWYRNMIYREERERGLDFTEDLFSPGEFRFEFGQEDRCIFWAGPAGREPTRGAFEVRGRELARREDLRSRAGGGLRGKLAIALDKFVVTSPNGPGVIAGYHWFGEWGRDTFVSLPGVFLATGDAALCRGIVLRYISRSVDNVIPNVLDPVEAINSIDASLWMVLASWRLISETGDHEFLCEIVPFVRAMADSFIRGVPGLGKAETTGLLRVYDGSSNATWMDAKVSGVPVIVRAGYPVEVNALWIRTLQFLARFDRKKQPEWRRLFFSACKEFLARFSWQGVGLYDRLDESGAPVREIRPNQVIACAVGGSFLPTHVQREAFDTALARLTTPRGLRTLDPGHHDYRGTYRGNLWERDTAYHQGTAWPWLLGPFFDLARRFTSRTFYGRLYRDLVSQVANVDENPCYGHIFEVADGSWPHKPGGAVAQAWSAAELLRTYPQKGALSGEGSDAFVGVSTRIRGGTRAPRG